MCLPVLACSPKTDPEEEDGRHRHVDLRGVEVALEFDGCYSFNRNITVTYGDLLATHVVSFTIQKFVCDMLRFFEFSSLGVLKEDLKSTFHQNYLSDAYKALF